MLDIIGTLSSYNINAAEEGFFNKEIKSSKSLETMSLEEMCEMLFIILKKQNAKFMNKMKSHKILSNGIKHNKETSKAFNITLKEIEGTYVAIYQSKNTSNPLEFIMFILDDGTMCRKTVWEVRNYLFNNMTRYMQ